MPAFEPGHSGENGGRTPSHGASLIEHINAMGKWPQEKIQAMADEASAPLVKRQAAKSLLRSMHDDFAKSGKPLAMDDLHLHLDYTDGRPVQRVDVVRTEVRDPVAMRLELLALVAENPALLASLGLALPGGVGDAGESGTEGGAPHSGP